MKTRRKPTVRKLVKKLDAIFSVWVRKRGADQFGIATCFTCGVRKPWKEMQCSHYVSRRHMNTRFDPRNCRPCCVSCNIFKHGALDDFAIALCEEYGDRILKELNQLKNQVKQWTVGELEELIKKYS